MIKIYKHKLPDNIDDVSIINVRVVNREIIIEVEEKTKFNPKDGDFLTEHTGLVFIYKDIPDPIDGMYSCYCGSYGFNEGDISIKGSRRWTYKWGCRYATAEEKVTFLRRLEKECHRRWNPKTKRLEIIRWRAKLGENYYRIITSSTVYPVKWREANDGTDDRRYLNGNYFRTPEATQKVADQIKEIFKNSEAE